MKPLRDSFYLVFVTSTVLFGMGTATVELESMKAVVTSVNGKVFVRYPLEEHGYYCSVCACKDDATWSMHYVTYADSCIRQPVSADDITLFEALVAKALNKKETN